jgi:hypothetical protein
LGLGNIYLITKVNVHRLNYFLLPREKKYSFAGVAMEDEVVRLILVVVCSFGKEIERGLNTTYLSCT